MKATQLTASLLALALASNGTVEAQTSACNAMVTKRTVTESKSREKYWDIIFDIAAPSCDASRGDFEFFVEVGATGGRRDRIQQTADFATEDGKRTAISVSFHARPGQEVLDVSGISVKQCACVKH